VTLRAKIILPLFLSLFGMWLLIGCIYLPIPEHSVDWSKTDFRPFLEASGSSPSIVRGKTTWREIVALLGRPYSASIDQTELIYTYDTEWDVTIWPLCFFVDRNNQALFPGGKRQIAVRFVFDAQDLLSDWKMAEDRGKPRYILGPHLTIPDAVWKLKHKDAQSRPTITRPAE